MRFPAYPLDMTRQPAPYVTSLFAAQEAGLRTSPHRGLDFGGTPVGTPVYAPAPGIVASAFFDDKGGGNVLFIDHAGVYEGLRTAYLHLDRFAVTRGQQVGVGQLIGYVGNTGSSTGPHLHWEVRTPPPTGSTSWARLDPVQFLPGPVNLSPRLQAQMNMQQIGPALVTAAGATRIVGAALVLTAGYFFWRARSGA